MRKPRIVVTSAAGHTGGPAVLELLKRGYPVRAFVYREDHRSEALKDAGAEIFVGDLNDMRDLRDAMKDVQRAYHCPPFSFGLLHNAMLFALAAEEARLECVVLLSQWQPHEIHPSIVSREHWIANNIYRWMPSVEVIHLNPGLFAFTYLLGLPAAFHFGMLLLPYGESRNAPASNEDIGRCAAALLDDPSSHFGKDYRPTGPRVITPYDVASDLSTILGRKVVYRNATSRMFMKAAIAQGFPLSEISQLRHYIADLNAGAYELGAPTNDVEFLTGRPPETFAETARRYVADPRLIHPKLTVGSRQAAVLMLLRMLLGRPPDLDRWEELQAYPRIAKPEPAVQFPAWVASAVQGRLYLQQPIQTAEGHAN